MQERRGDDVRRVIETVWQMESPKIIAALARQVGDFEAAEDIAQDALVAALEKWPETGVPPKPGAWLMTVAKNRAIDLLRRRQNQERKVAEMGHDLWASGGLTVPDIEALLDDGIDDDLLRLIFMCCHPWRRLGQTDPVRGSAASRTYVVRAYASRSGGARPSRPARAAGFPAPHPHRP